MSLVKKRDDDADMEANKRIGRLRQDWIPAPVFSELDTAPPPPTGPRRCASASAAQSIRGRPSATPAGGGVSGVWVDRLRTAEVMSAIPRRARPQSTVILDHACGEHFVLRLAAPVNSILTRAVLVECRCAAEEQPAGTALTFVPGELHLRAQRTIATEISTTAIRKKKAMSEPPGHALPPCENGGASRTITHRSGHGRRIEAGHYRTATTRFGPTRKNRRTHSLHRASPGSGSRNDNGCSLPGHALGTEALIQRCLATRRANASVSNFGRSNPGRRVISAVTARKQVASTCKSLTLPSRSWG